MTDETQDALLRPGLPDVVAVEVTSACNLECPMCPRSLGGINVGPPKTLLPDATWKAVAAVAGRIGFINLSGLSESLLHPRFLDMVEELGAQGARVIFSTNATLITPRIAERMARLSCLESVNVSVDSADPEEYRLIRGGNIERVRAGLKALVQATGGSLRITASAVLMKISARGIPQIPALLADVGIRNLMLQTVVDIKETTDDQSLPENTAEILAEVRREGARLGIDVFAVPYLEARARGEEAGRARVSADAPPAARTKICTAPWDAVAIDYQGRLFPCCNSPSWQNDVEPDSAVLGTVGPQSFEDVWHGDRIAQFRQGLLTGNLPQICQICPVVDEGVHPYVRMSARLLLEECRPIRSGVRIVAVNTGSETWTAESRLRIAPSRPRNRDCGLRTSRWMSWNRAASMREESVPPGARATFDLPLAVWRTSRLEIFQLVAEGLCWLPNTEVAVVPTRRWATAWPPGRWRFEVRQAPATLPSAQVDAPRHS